MVFLASITVTGEVTVPMVASTSISVTMGVDATTSVTRDNSHSTTQDWTITYVSVKSLRESFPHAQVSAGPGEIVSLQRSKITTTGTGIYTLVSFASKLCSHCVFC